MKRTIMKRVMYTAALLAIMGLMFSLELVLGALFGCTVHGMPYIDYVINYFTMHPFVAGAEGMAFGIIAVFTADSLVSIEKE